MAICPRCAGTGYLSCYKHVEGGVCFKCKGTGVVASKPSVPADPEPIQAQHAQEIEAQVTKNTDPADPTPRDLAITRKPLAFATKKDRLAYWRFMLGTVDAWALRGLARIYAEQTEDEQETETTAEDNGVGFTGVHAEILSSFAKQVEDFTPGGKYSTPLSAKQMALLRKKMPSYAKQLIALLGDEVAGTILPSKAAREAWLDIHGKECAA